MQKKLLKIAKLINKKHTLERSWWKPILHKYESTRESRYTLTNQINHLCDVVNKKGKPKITGEDGLVSLKIFAAIIKSAKTGKKVKIK